MAKSKRTTRSTTRRNQLINDADSVLALAAPLPPPPPPPPSPPILSHKEVNGESSTFLSLAEDESSPQRVESPQSAPDQVLVEDCSEEEDYEDEMVDYSTSGCPSGSPNYPTVSPSSGHNLDAALDLAFLSASRVLPLYEPGFSASPTTISARRSPPPVTAVQQTVPGCVEVAQTYPIEVPNVISSPTACPHPGHSAIPVAISTKRSTPPVAALPQASPSLVEVNHSSPTEVPYVISPSTACPHSGVPQPPAPVEKWRDLFATNRSSATGPKFPPISASCNELPCDLLTADLDINYNVWESCLVGYVAGKSPGFNAMNNIISNSWKCNATLSIHESGWLVYRFKNIEDKLAVLANGPYLIYGRPLILKVMPEYFNFGRDEMSCVPVWVKLPNLPLKCWSPRCLAKIASKLGTPIQSDQLTFNMTRISYARVLVELNLLADLKSSIVINLPNGSTLNQPVIYETLPRFCTSCKVLGHKTGACIPPPKPVAARSVAKENLPATTTHKDRSVFDRLGPVDGQIGLAASQGKPNGQISASPHSQDPMATEVEVASDGWDKVKGRKASTPPSIPNNAMGNKGIQQTLDPLQAEVEAVVGGWEVVKRKKSNVRLKEKFGPAPHRVPCRDNAVACSNKGKEVACPMDVSVRGDDSITHLNNGNEGRTAPAALSSGATIIHEAALAGASTSRVDRNAVSVGLVNNRGKRRSTSRGSGGRVLPSSTHL